jgi:hypothetical protein
MRSSVQQVLQGDLCISQQHFVPSTPRQNTHLNAVLQQQAHNIHHVLALPRAVMAVMKHAP